MILTIIAILVILLLLGNISIPFINIHSLVLFTLNGRPISMWDLLIFLVIIWVIGLLTRPLRQIAILLLIFWLLSLLGVIMISNFSSLIVVVLIAGLILHLLGIV